MPSVRVRENEYFDVALRRFKRACEKAGVLAELRRREFYEKPTQERKRKKALIILQIVIYGYLLTMFGIQLYMSFARGWWEL